MIYKLFLSRFDSEENLKQKEECARALGLKYWSDFVEIEANTIEVAISVFLENFFEDLAVDMDYPLYVAQVLEDGRIQVPL